MLLVERHDVGAFLVPVDLVGRVAEYARLDLLLRRRDAVVLLRGLELHGAGLFREVVFEDPVLLRDERRGDVCVFGEVGAGEHVVLGERGVPF